MVRIDELDWQVIDALQVNPRASWTLIGRVLGVDPVTAARRWQRLTDDGLVWVTAYPGWGAAKTAAANIEIDCAPGTAPRIAAALCEHPYTFNVWQTTGGRDLVVFAVTGDIPSLTRYLTEQVEAIPGVLSARSSIVTGVVSEGSTWRSGALNDRQRQQLSLPPYTGDARGLMDPLELRIMTALAIDGRMAVNDLAAYCDISPTTVRRRLPGLIDARRILLRTDLTQPLSDRPMAAAFFVEAAANALPQVGQRIAHLPGSRVCLNLAGPTNLVVEVWLPGPGHVRDFEILLDSQQLPLTVRDRSIIVRNHKHAYRVLDDTGRATRVVPYDFQIMATSRLS